MDMQSMDIQNTDTTRAPSPAEAVVEAAGRADVDAVTTILKNGDVSLMQSMRGDHGRRALLAACQGTTSVDGRAPSSQKLVRKGHEERVRDLVTHLVNAGARPGNELYHLLDVASATGDFKLFQLISRRFNHPSVDRERRLLNAVSSNNVRLARFLVKDGTESGSAVTEAVRLGYDNLARTLIVDGARVPADALLALVRRGDVQTLSFILKNRKIRVLDRILTEAIMYARNDIVEILLMRVMRRDKKLLSDALTRCAERGNAEACKLVIERMRELNLPTDDIDEALLTAILFKHADTARLLISQGADPNYYHGEALRRAAVFGTPELVALLLRKGADPNLVPAEILRSGRGPGFELIEHCRPLLTYGGEGRAPGGEVRAV